MKPCKYCKTSIDDQATVCPHCTKDQRNRFVRHWIVSTFLVLMFIWAIFWQNQNVAPTPVSVNTPPTAEEKPIEISSVELSKSYDANEINADGIYKWKKLIIEGKIEDIGVILWSEYIQLEWSNIALNVMCKLSKDSVAKAWSLSKWQTVKVSGIGNGKILWPVVDDCSIL